VVLGQTVGVSATFDDTTFAVLIVNDKVVDAILFMTMVFHR
jgi:hypothetical protein